MVPRLARTYSKGCQLLVPAMSQFTNNQQHVSSAPSVTVQVLHSPLSSGARANVVPLATAPLEVPITSSRDLGRDSVRGSVAGDKVW